MWSFFFKWIKQHLRIKFFYGTSENAIYLQIWIAVCTYLLLALTKKKMHMNQSLHTISKNVGLFLTDNPPINELFNKTVPEKGVNRLLYAEPIQTGRFLNGTAVNKNLASNSEDAINYIIKDGGLVFAN